MTTQTYIDIAARKREQVNALIPKEWRLDDKYIPAGMRQTAEESVYKIDDIKEEYRTPLIEILRQCGILSSRELHITEEYDVEGLLREMANKRLSAEEVATAFCKRSAIAQQLTRCITEPLFSNALAEARELDAHLARTGQPIGPLHGLPVSVKDSFNVKGIDSSLGVTALCFKPAAEDAALVQLLRSLGAIIVAKTNIPQTLALLDSVNHVFGRTLNPVYAKLTPGGSSGGEGVLVTMRGSMIGFGTDVGGSIRVPAMCNNIYGFKPSVGRISYQGQTSFGRKGMTHVALKAAAGPIARSVRDIDTVMKELVPRATVFADDCIPAGWCPSPRNGGVAAAPTKPKLRIGILRHDGLIMPLPPVLNILEEVSGILAKSKIADIEVVDVPTPAITKQCFANAGRLMGVDGGNAMLDLISSTGEPLVPSLKGMKRRTPYTLEKLCALNAEREEIESEMRKSLWSMPASTRTTSSATSLSPVDRDRIDAIVLPLAAHPVPRHDQYGSVTYTSMLNLLDYPAGAIPVRKMTARDLKLDFNTNDKTLSKWDAENRKLWQGDRSIYLNTPLSVQVITPKLHDYELCHAMGVIDAALKAHYGQQNSDRAML